MKLSNNQRKIITALPRKPEDEVQSSEFTASLKISASSAQQSVDVLTPNDLVFRDNKKFYRGYGKNKKETTDSALSPI